MGLVTNSLPPYSGPYPVSTTDLELPLPSSSPSPPSFSSALLKSTHQPALQLSTILFTLYYPSSHYPPSIRDHAPRMPWLERPLARTAKGYAKFLAKKEWIVKSVVWLFGRNLYLPVPADQPLFFSPTTPTTSKSDELGEKRSDINVDDDKDDGSTQDEDHQQFPVVIFSHGLSGNRTTYSQYCGELASQGYIVAAIEHRDGSGPISVVKNQDGSERIVDYIKQDDIYYPDLEEDDHQPPPPFLTFRASQLVLRQSEISHLVSFVSLLNSGQGSSLENSNLRPPPTSPGLNRWKARLDLNRVVMAGHSFGGATTIQVLRAQSTSTSKSSSGSAQDERGGSGGGGGGGGEMKIRFEKGIALDPWMDPIPPAETSLSSSSSSSPSNLVESVLSAMPDSSTSSASAERQSRKDNDDDDDSSTSSSPLPAPPPNVASSTTQEMMMTTPTIQVPFLVINSEAFTLWKPHFYLVRNIVTSITQSSSWFFTILGSIHLSFSDLPLIFPLSSRSATTPPSLSHGIIVKTSLDFLNLTPSSGQGGGESLEMRVRDGDEEYVNERGRGEGEKGPLKRDEEEGEGYLRVHVRHVV